ncbi:MAG: pfk-4 [Acidimicrobiia bacterium]|nr:pfk-4 [Acidimicrobiia bacterium]
MTILTVTLNPALDVCASVDVLEPDRKMHCRDVVTDAGGGGINVARVASRLGADSVAAFLSGGATGERLCLLLQQEGIRTEVIRIAGEVRENLTAIELSSGRQYRFVLPGPVVSPEEFTLALERVAALAAYASLAVVSGSLPAGVTPKHLAAMVARLRTAGAQVIVDTSGDALLAAAAIGTVLMKPSLRELSVFAGEPLRNHAEIERAARTLLDLGPNGAVIVSLAGAGALLVEQGGQSVWIHAPQVAVASTVGAGDSLVAAVAVSLEGGDTLLEAACFGVAAGSAATLAHGTGLCRRDDVNTLRALVSVSSPQGLA